MSLESQIVNYLEKNPGMVQKDLVRNFPNATYSYLAKTKSNWKRGKLGKKKKKGKKSKKVKKKNKDPGTISDIDVPEDIKKISDYMKYFDQKGLTVKFNEVLTYLDKTKQLNEQGGSELTQQMTTNQLLAVIKPNESLLPVNSPSMSSSKDSISLTSPPTSKS